MSLLPSNAEAIDPIARMLFRSGLEIFGLLAFLGIFLILFYFLYRFITMSTQPREAMKSIYLYLVTFIGLMFLLVGGYAVIDYLFDSLFQIERFRVEAMWATALTNILVGVVLFGFHWKLALSSKK